MNFQGYTISKKNSCLAKDTPQTKKKHLKNSKMNQCEGLESVK